MTLWHMKGKHLTRGQKAVNAPNTDNRPERIPSLTTVEPQTRSNALSFPKIFLIPILIMSELIIVEASLFNGDVPACIYATIFA